MIAKLVAWDCQAAVRREAFFALLATGHFGFLSCGVLGSLARALGGFGPGLCIMGGGFASAWVHSVVALGDAVHFLPRPA